MKENTALVIIWIATLLFVSFLMVKFSTWWFLALLLLTPSSGRETEK